MKVQSLNGVWNYRIGKGKLIERQVPFSTLPVGYSECSRTFVPEISSEKTFLKFDGITYAAKVFLNGTLLGEMLPYSEYTFEITEVLCEGENELRVELSDIEPAFGPTEGWENYGGIIRDVSLLYSGNDYIQDVFFYYDIVHEKDWDGNHGGKAVGTDQETLIRKVEQEYYDAVFTLETKVIAQEGVSLRMTLFADEEIIYQSTQPASDRITGTIKNIRLWSMDSPVLYRLEIELLRGNKICDTYTCMVGFKELRCDKHRFYLNGKPLYLKGVCKHEMIGDSGHCPSVEQMEEDMRLIKETGCNFVRLVHYPHHKKILEIADRIGLMVSEEPGLWWSDTSDPEVSAGSLEVLRRTILRDRNHVSIAFWLCFNECCFTEQFLIDSARVCRENDPTRLVSGANCMSDEDTLKYYQLCGFDFYTMHPYSQTIDRAKHSAAVLNDKPLVFTEWGGHFVYNNPKLLAEFMEEMYGMYERNSDEGALAGAFFWCWAEVNDFNRGEPACVDGNLCEGLVNRYREPTLIYETYRKTLQMLGQEKKEASFWISYCEEAKEDEEAFLSQNLLPEGDPTVLREVISKVVGGQRETSMRKRIIEKGPVLAYCGTLCHVPVVIADGVSLEIPVPDDAGRLSANECGSLRRNAERADRAEVTDADRTDADRVDAENCDRKDRKSNTITLYGLCSLNKGYPLGGGYGEAAMEVIMESASGECIRKTLRNGQELTTVFMTNGSSRIEPFAENAQRFASFGYDKNFEMYVMNRLEIPVTCQDRLARITVRSLNKGYEVLLYGIGWSGDCI